MNIKTKEELIDLIQPFVFKAIMNFDNREDAASDEAAEGIADMILDKVLGAELKYREGLEKEIDQLESEAADFDTDYDMVVKELEQTTSKVEQLREALKPFADAIIHDDPNFYDDGDRPRWAEFFVMSDFRRAAVTFSVTG